MNNIDLVNDRIRQLKDAKSKLEHEIDNLHSEIDKVQQSQMGVMNMVKKLVTMQVGRENVLEGLMEESIARVKNYEFKSPSEYIDHLRRSQDEARASISKINEILSNLETVVRDQSALETRLNVWVNKAKDLVR